MNDIERIMDEYHRDKDIIQFRMYAKDKEELDDMLDNELKFKGEKKRRARLSCMSQGCNVLN